MGFDAASVLLDGRTNDEVMLDLLVCAEHAVSTFRERRTAVRRRLGRRQARRVHRAASSLPARSVLRIEEAVRNGDDLTDSRLVAAALGVAANVGPDVLAAVEHFIDMVRWLLATVPSTVLAIFTFARTASRAEPARPLRALSRAEAPPLDPRGCPSARPDAPRSKLAPLAVLDLEGRREGLHSLAA